MFTLKTLSPSRTSLSIPPISPGRSTSIPSPSSSTGKSPSASGEYFPRVSPSSASASASTRTRLTKRISKDEAFKNVKLLEDVLAAWNEYRICISNLGKSSRKLAGSLKDLAAGSGPGSDKVDVASQTIRPTASMLDGISDLTLKLARKVDKEYDEVNGDASKYFTLLAKESRTHEAYLGAIGKKHDKAEKAYRKASKALSETSNAHAGLLALKNTLGDDINRANEDHQLLLGSKQSTIVLKIASSSGVLAANIFAYFSDGLRKTGQSYPDVEYFRTLADIKWQNALPPSLEHEIAEEKIRDQLRGMKAQVALGELEVIGQSTWNELQKVPSQNSISDQLNDAKIQGDMTPISPPSSGLQQGIISGSHQDSKSTLSVPVDADIKSKITSDVIRANAGLRSDIPPSSGATVTLTPTANKPSTQVKSGLDTARNVNSPPVPHHSRPSTSSQSHSSRPSASMTSSASTKLGIAGGEQTISTSPRTVSASYHSSIGPNQHDIEDARPQHQHQHQHEHQHEPHSHHQIQADKPRHGEEINPGFDRESAPMSRSMAQNVFTPLSENHSPPSPAGTLQQSIRPRPGPIPIQQRTGHGHQHQRRSVSNILPSRSFVGEDRDYYQYPRPLDRDQSVREKAFRAHQDHRAFMKGCELCEIDYERM
ncbi:uncharacterized protein I303_103408 [Kwoniella dejecticola CBS 10117]|uniref:IMD domain-containing protein n=1 Tax=Kwoniella dejecticola CBS 10117 TaxID=1296121 RepID=A0AAJ8MH34_9TREE